MRPFPLLRISNENPGAGAQKWRIREIVDQGGGFLGTSHVMFLKEPGDLAQPGAGVAFGTPSSAGGSSSPATAFDGTQEYAGAYNVDGSTYLEFDFALTWDIKELYYQARAGFPTQSPRHLTVEKFYGGSWVVAAELFGIPFWAGSQIRRFAITGYTDDVGANAHRYWRLTGLQAYSGSGGLMTEVEIELLDATDTNVAPNFDKFVGTMNAGYLANITDGVIVGDNYGIINFAETVAFDFYKKRDIRKVRLTCRSTNLTQAILKGRLEWSDDNATWNEYMSFDNTTPWTVFSGCSITGGAGSCSGAASMFEQDVLTAGVTYDFSFNYNKTAGSKLRIENGAGIAYTSAVLANGAGTISGTFTATGNQFRIAADTATYSGTIDNAVINVTGGGPNLLADGTFTKPSSSPGANETRTFTKGVPKLAAGSVPAISGTITTYGNTLTLDRGLWINAPTSYTIQWRKDGVAIPGANALTYDTVAGDLNHNIDATVLAHNEIGDSLTATAASVYIGIPGSTAFNWTDPNVLTAHRYWRLLWGAVQSGTLATIAELYLKNAAGANIAGTWSAWNSANGAASNLSDGNAASFWGDGGSSSALDRWVKLDLGAGNSAIVDKIEMTPRTGFQSQTPWDFYLQYSDDNATWFDATKFNRCDAWGSGVRKIFDVRPYIVRFLFDNAGSINTYAELEVLNGSGTDLTVATPANDNDRGRPFGNGDAGAYAGYNDNLSDYSGNGNPIHSEWRFSGIPDCFGVSVRARSGFSSQAPVVVKVLCSRDGINFNAVYTSAAQPAWASGERRTFSF
jgi:hypothetical protein